MNFHVDAVALWLADFHLLAMALLVGVLTFSSAPRFSVRHADFALKRLPATDIPGRADGVLMSAGKIVGRVINDEGQGVAGATVVIRSSQSPESSPRSSDVKGYKEYWSRVYDGSVQADEKGRFVIPSLFAGQFDVWADAPGLLDRGLSGIAVKAGETMKISDLTLTRCATIRVKFVDIAT